MTQPHGRAAEMERVEQKDQKVGKYEEGSEPLIGAELQASERRLALHAARILT